MYDMHDETVLTFSKMVGVFDTLECRAAIQRLV